MQHKVKAHTRAGKKVKAHTRKIITTNPKKLRKNDYVAQLSTLPTHQGQKGYDKVKRMSHDEKFSAEIKSGRATLKKSGWPKAHPAVVTAKKGMKKVAHGMTKKHC